MRRRPHDPFDDNQGREDDRAPEADRRLLLWLAPRALGLALALWLLAEVFL